MTLFRLVQVCMAPMMMDSGLFCGRSYHGCVPEAHGMVFSRRFQYYQVPE